MLRVGVMVSGGGTNLQAILDAVDAGEITNAEIAVVISNNPGAYALERAKKHGVEALCISPKDYESRDAFNEAFLAKVDEYHLDLIVLAGFLVKIPAVLEFKCLFSGCNLLKKCRSQFNVMHFLTVLLCV